MANTINYGGTLILTNTGGTVNGTKTYKLFQANTINAGSGFTVITQAIAGVSYDLSQLNTAGTVTLTGPGAPVTPTNIVFQVSSNQLELSWPPSYIAWTLVTNANVANTNTWFPYLPLTSGNTNRVFVTINPALSNVFYQLRLPQP